MRILLVTSVDAWTRSVASIHKWIELGNSVGHDIAVFGESNPELPHLKFTTDLNAVDLALFVVQVPSDFPDMPDLARVLDTVPKEKRAVVDLWARFNETTRVDHDFNHLEKLDGHQGWEWREAIAAVSKDISQPSLSPRAAGVKPFLFHGFDKNAIVKNYASAKEAASAWRDKPYGAIYLGSNWQRWHQTRVFLEAFGKVKARAGRACLVGWDWAERPHWAIEKGIMGVDTDAAFLDREQIEVRHGVRFDEVPNVLGQAKFSPIIHRPLFRELGFVTNRTFETFYADTIPILMLPEEFVSAIYGQAAFKLVPTEGIDKLVSEALQNPEVYWDAVLRTREHLAANHSYEIRLQELRKATSK